MEKFLSTGCFQVANTGPNTSSLTSDCQQNTIQYKLCQNIVQGRRPHTGDFNQDAHNGSALIKLRTWQLAHKGSSSTLPSSFTTFPVSVSIMVSPALRLRCPPSAFSVLGVTRGFRSLSRNPWKRSEVQKPALTTEAHSGQGDLGLYTQLPYRTRMWAIIRHCSLHMVTVPRFAAEGIHRTEMR